MKQIIMTSGKGGTGKTSIAASFASLAGNCVLADCDVDASNLHILVEKKRIKIEDHVGAQKSRILPGHCMACGKCEEICAFSAITFDGHGNGRVDKTFRIDPIKCEGCGVCAHFCQYKAIETVDVANGQIFTSESKYGPFVHAKLGIAESNSGKLVAEVRERAKQLSEKHREELVLIDGAPGIGCPVVASITGTDYAVVVTEPTVSGLHDMERIASLLSHFGVSGGVIVNRFDLNEEKATLIENWVNQSNLDFLGRVHYDSEVTRHQTIGKPFVENLHSKASEDVIEIWKKLLFKIS